MMVVFIEINWVEIFSIGPSITEHLIRGSCLYFAILIMLRILPRRTGGELAMMDLIFILLVAEAASHSLGEYTSLIDGLIVILTLMGWNYVINMLSYYFPWFEKLVSSPPIQIVKDGKVMRRNMRKEYLTEDELMEYLRKQGVEDIQEVKSAFVEGEGEITVIRNKSQ